MPYIDDATVAALRGGVNLGIFLRIDTSPDPLRLWFGVNDIPVGIEAIDEDGAVYIGAGKLIGLPELQVLINGLADRLEFYVAGVNSDFTAQIAEAAPGVRGKEVNVGITALDSRYQPLSSIKPLWTGFAGFWAVQRKAQPPGGNQTQTILLSVGTGDLARSRSARTYWTNPQQQRLSSLLSAIDRFCDRVARYTRNYEVSWPRF